VMTTSGVETAREKYIILLVRVAMYTTVVSRASAHSRVSAHVPHFKGLMLQLLYKCMEVISRVSAKSRVMFKHPFTYDYDKCKHRGALL
jgi:hypothetical protein